MTKKGKAKSSHPRRKSIGVAGRISAVSTAGDMVTGLVEPGWSPVAPPKKEVVLQIGAPSKEHGLNTNLPLAIASHMDLQSPAVITIDTSARGAVKCGLADSSQGASRGEGLWYDIEEVSDELPDSWSLLILNKTSEPFGHSGILDHVDLLERSARVVVSNIEDPSQHGLALRISQACRGFIRLDEIKMGKRGKKATFAVIEPAPQVRTPSPLPYPSIAKILPRRMLIPNPIGVANDYRHISAQVAEQGRDWVPNLKISIVIPLYNRREMLGRTLAMIAHQTYPLDLLEIVVADDGSSDDPISMIERFQDKLDIQYVRQADLGYRLSEVRNLGIRSSKHDYVILLDCDMAPVPTMVETYARHLGVSTRALYCGHRRYVDANHITVENVVKSPGGLLALPDIETVNEKMKRDGHVLDWRMPMYRQSDNLRFEKYPFRAVCGGNIGFHKSLFERAKEFDEAFRAWGKEDTEWGFRVWNRGDYIVPLYEACGLHMEPSGGRNETDRELGLEEVMPIFVDRVPVMYRKHEHGVCHSVPLVSIYVPAYNAEDSIVETVRSALDQTFEDLEVCIAVDGAKDGTLKQLERYFLDNPRVRWTYQENQGIGGASNTALQMCRGVFIGQLDSDDLLLPDAVEIMLEEIQRDTRLGVVYGSFQKETPEGIFLEDGYDWPQFSREKLMYGCIVHHFRMFRARDWWRTDGFATDIRNAVDYDMFLKLSEVTEMKHVQEWSYVYRIHDSSTSVSETDQQIKNHYASIQRTLERRGLEGRWQAIPKGGSDSRLVRFAERKGWDSAKDTTTPFARMQSKMREATPLLVQYLAKREANKKPWTIATFPRERVAERLQALAHAKGLKPTREDITRISTEHYSNLWVAFDQLKSLGTDGSKESGEGE